MIPTLTGISGLQYVASLTPAAWYRYGVGITVATGVSAWADQSGNGRDLLQGTGTLQPLLQADNSILFDGVGDFLRTSTFTLNQPLSIYILMKQLAWVNGNFIVDGSTAAVSVKQAGTTPEIRINAGLTFSGPSLTIGTYGVIASVFNGASSSVKINNGTASVGNVGATNSDGLTLGASRVPDLYTNIQVKEVIAFASAHDATTQARVISYLGAVGGLGL